VTSLAAAHEWDRTQPGRYRATVPRSSNTTRMIARRVASSLWSVLSEQEIQAFGIDGYLVVPGVVPERVLAELDEEVDALVAGTPPPPGKVGFHHYFEHPSRLPVAQRALQDSGALALAGELVAPLAIDLAFDHIQIATSIFGWDHEPGGGHIDGYGIAGQTEPATFTLLAGHLP
jgi:hypothetical protein